MRTTFLLSLLAVLSSVGVPPALAQQAGPTVIQRGEIREDSYLAGGTVYGLASVRGDLTAAGGQVTIENEVTGDVLAAGGSVTVRARVGDDVRAGGGNVTLAGEIGDDAIAAGGSVMLAPGAAVGGRAWFAGGNIEVHGKVAKTLRAAGGHITIGGDIGGDAELAGERIDIGPGAVIHGNLHYRSRHEARIDSGAKIIGTITREELPVRAGGAAFARLGFIASLMLAAIVLYLLFPNASLSAARAMRDAPWKSLGLGLALLVGIPLVIVLLFVTLLGVWLALSLLALYLVFLLLGYLTGVLCLGDIGLGLIVPKKKKPTRAWRALSIVAVLVALWVIGFIPVLRGLVGFAVLLFGLGGLALFLARGYRQAR